MKKWWKSKTLWVNVIAFGCFLAQSFLNVEVRVVEQGAILTLVNLIVRLRTKEEIE